MTFFCWVRSAALPAAGLLVLSACSNDPSTWRCRVTGPEARDVDDARSACEHARATFAQLLGRTAPAIVLELGDSWGGRPRRWRRVPQLRISTLRAYDEGRSRSANPDARRGEWQDFVAHEVMHVLLAKLPGAQPESGEYGTAFPDWLDEGLAIAAEADGLRARRLEQAREAIDRLPTVDTLLVARHPSRVHPWPRGVERVTVNIVHCAKPCQRPGYRSDTVTIIQTRVDGQLKLDTIYGPNQFSAVANNLFAVGSYALLEFLRRTLGDEAIAGLASAYRDEALRHTLPLGQSAIGSDLDAIDSAWKTWLRSGQEPRALR